MASRTYHYLEPIWIGEETWVLAHGSFRYQNADGEDMTFPTKTAALAKRALIEYDDPAEVVAFKRAYLDSWTASQSPAAATGEPEPGNPTPQAVEGAEAAPLAAPEGFRPGVFAAGLFVGPYTPPTPGVRTFASGANRDTADGKLEPFGFMSALVVKRFSEYMDRNRHLADGTVRAADNWKKGIPIPEYWKSLSRHILDVWLIRDGHPDQAREQDLEDALCATLFNVSGMLHETIRERLDDGER